MRISDWSSDVCSSDLRDAMSIHSQRGAPDIELDVPSADQDDEVVGSAGRRRLVLADMCEALVAVVSSVAGLTVAQQARAAGPGAPQSPPQCTTNDRSGAARDGKKSFNKGSTLR